jgi:GR25 family glycosyltransferase involved in LPS biosynthesis
VFFTAENWNVPADPRISLYLTPSKTEDATHMRLPTWMTFIDWYSGSTILPEQSTDNPIRLPVHFAKTVPPLQERSQFCGFVVSNPVCKLRNDTFQVINNYKKVNSGGALYNNIGGQLALLYPGGGCGDLSKHHFFKQHKFTISFENSQAPGYITEKVLHSKMAGCIPLYWGDKDTDTDFARDSIVNVSHITRPEDMLEVLKQLEQDSVRCHQIATTPILNEASYQNALQILKTMSERILSLCNQSSPAKITKTFVINLDTRQDRWKSLMDAEPSLQSYATRVSAVNGKTLTMNSMIYNLFHMNQFQWKKSVIGCNLSHISVWSQITKEEGDYFLVLEDDARFAPNWMETWKAYAKDIPADADLLYLGGILPPNKPALPSVLEPVNAHWATIKPNTLFSQTPVSLFHFCAYSYILRKSGAKKLMTYLTQSDMKSFTVSDHLLGHPSIGLKKYIATPLLTHCFQDSDPVYQQSHFNDLQRQDTFDSDIWNNKERFTETDLMPYRDCFPSEEVVTHLAALLQPMIAPGASPHEANGNAAAVDTPSTAGIPVYAIPGTGLDCEKQWLEDMFQSILSVKPIQAILPKNSILLIQRTPPTFQQGKYKDILDAQTPKSIILLHISDENGQDPILLYNHPSVKHVIRNYYRKDCADQSMITILPLGYSTKASIATPIFTDRSLMWSFAGSIDRPGRQEALCALEALTPFEKQTKLTFGAPSPLKGTAYTDQLLRSKFIPAFRGFWSLESFRMYEALEAGCIPLYVPSEGTNGDEYTTVLGKSPILALPSWVQAPTLLEQLSKNAAVMEQHRQDLQTWWKEKKQSLRTTLSKVLSS